jgi:hypothetical protein
MSDEAVAVARLLSGAGTRASFVRALSSDVAPRSVMRSIAAARMIQPQGERRRERMVDCKVVSQGARVVQLS